MLVVYVTTNSIKYSGTYTGYCSSNVHIRLLSFSIEVTNRVSLRQFPGLRRNQLDQRLWRLWEQELLRVGFCDFNGQVHGFTLPLTHI